MSRSPAIRLLAALLAGLALACVSRPKLGGVVKVSVEFVGEVDVERSAMEAAIAPDLENLERRNSPRSAVDDAAYTLADLLRDRGFSLARVDYEVLESTPTTLSARFLLRPGPRTRVTRIDFEGARRFDRRDLVSAMGMRDPNEPGGAPMWFVERQFERAADALEAFYVERGHARVSVERPTIALDDSGERASVVFEVDEGPRFVLIAAPTVSGGVAELDATLDWSALVGKPLTPRAVQQARGMVGELYERSGYPDVRVAPVRFEYGEDGAARATVSVEPGQRVLIGEVRITGAGRTRSGFVRDMVGFAKGQAYDVRVLRESFRRLFATGLFTRVQTRLEPEGAAVRDLVVELEEAPSREVYFEPGLGSYEGPRALVGWRDINLFGYGRVLRVEGLAATRAQRALVSVTEPRLFDFDLQASLSVFREIRDEPSFDKDERGVGLTFLRNISDFTRGELEYRFRQSVLTSVDISDPLAQEELDDYDIGSLLLGVSWDNRDSIFTPSKGLQSRLSLEVAAPSLGSELSFLRARLQHAAFVALTDRSILGLSYRAGVIAPVDDTSTIPLQERFFNGGENTVRSFREDQLGPKDSTGEPLGGEAFNVISIELRQELFGALAGAFFYDTGNVEPLATDFLSFDGFRHGVGVGLRYALPIGPLRLDFAANPDPRDGESDWVTHFSLGMSF